MEEDKNYISMIHGDLTRAAQMQNGMPENIGVMSIKTANRTILEASQLPTPRALWDSFWYEGELSCLFADSNVGKSILAVQIADRIARTDNVLYLDFELSEKQFQLRYTDEYGKPYIFPERLYRVSLDCDALLDADFEGKIIGKDFPAAVTETTLSGYYAAGGTGDKKLVYRTDIINAYPQYPVFEGEKYVSLAYKYLLIDQDHKLAVLNEVLCNVEYQPDGSSNNMLRQYLKNPQGFAFWRVVKMQHPESFKRLLLDCIHYCSSSQIAGNRNYIKESPRKLLTVLCTPAGWALTGYIRRKAR